MSLDRIRKWIESLAADVELLEKFVADPKGREEPKRLCAAGLNYLVTRMDLIPDWEEACGVMDDAMVLRVAAAIASDKELGPVAEPVERGVHKLANEADVVSEFLGKDLYPKFKKYVAELADKPVRNRTPAQLVADEKLRKALHEEIALELSRLPPPAIKDPVAVEQTIKNYFQTKLKG